MAKRRNLLAGGAALLVGVLSVAALVADGSPSRNPDEPRSASTPTAAPATAPTEPPARICGNTKALAGPAAPPAGAVVVSTKQNLQTLTAAHPAGIVGTVEGTLP